MRRQQRYGDTHEARSVIRAKALDTLRGRVAALGGIAPVVRGPGGLGEQEIPAPEIQRRIKAAFDPAGIFAPGRMHL